MSRALTIRGVREGLASSIRATVPETAGALKDVPLQIRYVPVASALVVLVLPNTVSPTKPRSPPPLPPVVVYELLAVGEVTNDSEAPMRLPGATRSGLTSPSTSVGPRDE